MDFMQFYCSNETAITDSRHVSPTAVTIELNLLFDMFLSRGVISRTFSYFTCLTYVGSWLGTSTSLACHLVLSMLLLTL